MPQTSSNDQRKFVQGLAVGLLAASIGALYTVFARWGISRGLSSSDLTVLRFGVAGVLMLPVMAAAFWRDRAQFTTRWRIWLLIALLAGTPFGLLMFGALQFAPPSHAAVFVPVRCLLDTLCPADFSAVETLLVFPRYPNCP